jgi:hypothetical protein
LQAVFAFDGAFAPDSAAALPVIAVSGVLAGFLVAAVVGEHKKGSTPNRANGYFQPIDSKLDSLVPGVGLGFGAGVENTYLTHSTIRGSRGFCCIRDSEPQISPSAPTSKRLDHALTRLTTGTATLTVRTMESGRLAQTVRNRGDVMAVGRWCEAFSDAIVAKGRRLMLCEELNNLIGSLLFGCHDSQS